MDDLEQRFEDRMGEMTYAEFQQSRSMLIDLLAERIDAIKQDMADDAVAAEDTGERVDLHNYVVELELEIADRLLETLRAASERSANLKRALRYIADADPGMQSDQSLAHEMANVSRQALQDQ